MSNFKFSLDGNKPKITSGGWAKEATVHQFPISKGIAGVHMFLDAGASRELHWHAIAEEWAFVIDGQCRTMILTPEGTSEINNCKPGDLWFFSKGHGHSIQMIGDKPCHVILSFNNGAFPEHGTFSVTDWVNVTPRRYATGRGRRSLARAPPQWSTAPSEAPMRCSGYARPTPSATPQTMDFTRPAAEAADARLVDARSGTTPVSASGPRLAMRCPECVGNHRRPMSASVHRPLRSGPSLHGQLTPKNDRPGLRATWPCRILIELLQSRPFSRDGFASSGKGR